MEEMVPFNRFLGMKIILLTSEEAIISLPWKEEFVGDPQRQAVHGGILSSLIDVCGGSACWMAITEPDTRLSTVDLRVDFSRKGPCEDLECRAEVVRMGSSVAVARMEVYAAADPEKKIIATGQGVYNLAKNVRYPRD
jgi:uncharacterized protein (TIGR00369 family)